jgi:heat shock protein HslJ
MDRSRVTVGMDDIRRLRAQHRFKLAGRFAAAALMVVVAAGVAACVQQGASPGATAGPSGAATSGPSAGPTDPSAAGPLNLEGTTWRATLVRDAEPIAGAEPTMRFEGGQAGGTTGCNTYGGAYTLDAEGAFSVASMIMTEMGCDGPIGNQERAVIEILTAADTLELLDDGQIRISGAQGSITFAEDPR